MKLNDKTLVAERKVGNIVPKPSFEWGIPGQYKKDSKKRKANRLARKSRKTNR